MRRHLFLATLGLASVLTFASVSTAQIRVQVGPGGVQVGPRGGGYDSGRYYGPGRPYDGGRHYDRGYRNDSGYRYGSDRGYRSGVTIWGMPFGGYRNDGGRTYYSEPSEAYVPAEPENSNVAMFEVRVPADAEVWFGKSKTGQTGSVRRFESPELEPGRSFAYDVRARWTDADGKVVDRTKEVKIRAGDRVGVDFND